MEKPWIGGASVSPVQLQSQSLPGILLYELTVGITPFYSSNVEEMYHKIVNGKLRFPPKLSESCKNLITGVISSTFDSRLNVLASTEKS
jgi:serine/threonine protein kinase